jgi:UDP-N-acetylglucosamine/UDP-N-acetylgalactosamine diphosphorylase
MTGALALEINLPLPVAAISLKHAAAETFLHMDASLREKLAAVDQQEPLRFWDQLDETARTKLRKQLQSLDLGEIDELAEKHVRHTLAPPLPTDIQPVRAFPHRPITAEQQRLYADARRRGDQLLAEGKIGAFLVAGGQGTRLGYEGPKGEFPVTPMKNKPLFQVFAERPTDPLVHHDQHRQRRRDPLVL